MSNEKDYLLDTTADVNWDALTVEQVQKLGLSINFFNEAIEHKNVTRGALKARLAGLFVAVVAGIILLKLTNPECAVAGVIGGLAVGTALEALNFYRATRDANVAADELDNNIFDLQQK